MSIAGALSLGTERSGHIKAQNTRFKCRRSFTVLRRHIAAQGRSRTELHSKRGEAGTSDPFRIGEGREVFFLPDIGLPAVCCRSDRTDMFIKDRRAAPALGLRSLQPYVSAALRPERKRVRNGHICPVRHLSTAESFLIPAEKKLPSVKGRKPSLSF